MKKIVLISLLTLTLSIAALAGCTNGTMNKANTGVPNNAQQMQELTETTLDEKENKDTDCHDGRCKKTRDGENRQEPDLDNDETEENKIPKHRSHHEPRKGHGHGRRPHPRPMHKQNR